MANMLIPIIWHNTNTHAHDTNSTNLNLNWTPCDFSNCTIHTHTFSLSLLFWLYEWNDSCSKCRNQWKCSKIRKIVQRNILHSDNTWRKSTKSTNNTPRFKTMRTNYVSGSEKHKEMGNDFFSHVDRIHCNVWIICYSTLYLIFLFVLFKVEAIST